MTPEELLLAMEDDPKGVIIDVWAVPGSSNAGIVGLHDTAVRIRAAAPAQAGKANKEIIKLLKRRLGTTEVTLVEGRKGRRKRFQAAGVTAAQAAALLSQDE